MNHVHLCTNRIHRNKEYKPRGMNKEKMVCTFHRTSLMNQIFTSIRRSRRSSRPAAYCGQPPSPPANMGKGCKDGVRLLMLLVAADYHAVQPEQWRQRHGRQQSAHYRCGGGLGHGESLVHGCGADRRRSRTTSKGRKRR